MTWTLRPGDITDVDALHALDVLCFEEAFRFDHASMQSFVAQPGSLTILAEADGALVGFVVVHQRREEKNRIKGYVEGYIVTLDVAPSHRRTGVARALMAAAESQVDTMHLHVYAGNHPALAFYERGGYRRLFTEPDFYGDSLDAWVCQKDCKRHEPGRQSARSSVGYSTK